MKKRVRIILLLVICLFGLFAIGFGIYMSKTGYDDLILHAKTEFLTDHNEDIVAVEVKDLHDNIIVVIYGEKTIETYILTTKNEILNQRNRAEEQAVYDAILEEFTFDYNEEIADIIITQKGRFYFVRVYGEIHCVDYIARTEFNEVYTWNYENRSS